MPSRYVDEMTREDLVEEIKSLVECGAFAAHEVGDPTILGAPELRRGVKRLRLRILVEGRQIRGDGGPPTCLARSASPLLAPS